MAERACSIDGCARPLKTHGWCGTHYECWRRSGSPFPRTDADRFWEKVNRTGLCWEWTGCLTTQGYGQFRLDGRNEGAHRVAWTWFFGPIPEGREMDHLCRNRGCVRPSHLEPVTRKENTDRGIAGEVNRRRLIGRPRWVA